MRSEPNRRRKHQPCDGSTAKPRHALEKCKNVAGITTLAESAAKLVAAAGRRLPVANVVEAVVKLLSALVRVVRWLARLYWYADAATTDEPTALWMLVSRFRLSYCFVVVITVCPLAAKPICATSSELARHVILFASAKSNANTIRTPQRRRSARAVRQARVADLLSSRPDASQIPIHCLCGTPGRVQFQSV